MPVQMSFEGPETLEKNIRSVDLEKMEAKCNNPEQKYRDDERHNLHFVSVSLSSVLRCKDLGSSRRLAGSWVFITGRYSSIRGVLNRGFPNPILITAHTTYIDCSE